MTNDDNKRLLKRKADAAWPKEQLDTHVAERNAAAANRIFERNSMINPITGKVRRPTFIENGGGPHGWLRRSHDPCAAWRAPRRRGDF